MCSPSHSQEPNNSFTKTQPLDDPINPLSRPDPDHESPNESEEEGKPAEEVDENPGMIPSKPLVSTDIVEPNGIPAETCVMTSPTYLSKRVNKRKKGKGIWNIKKMQSIEKKVQTLVERLNLVPFSPSNKLDFAKHEELLKRIGLWDFVHIDFQFDKSSFHTDLIAQLVVTYDPKARCSYVNTNRVMVNRADLARALKLPVKKEKSSNLVGDGVDLEGEALSEELVDFVENLVSNWMLLHEDADLWVMPDEVMNFTRPISEGHPEKVDWAGLLWFMIEKELMKGDQLMNCYYASHLQYLIRSQREELLREPEVGRLQEELEGEEATELVTREEGENLDYNEELEDEEDACNEENIDDLNDLQGEETDVSGVPNVELTLGQKVEEEVKDAEMVNLDEFKEDDGEKVEEEVKDAEMVDLDEFKEDDGDLDPRLWIGEHLGDGRGVNGLDERKEEDGDLGGEEETVKGKDGFDCMPTNANNLHGDELRLMGNFLEPLETTQLTFGFQGQLNHEPSIDLIESHNELQHMEAHGPSFFNSKGKREIVHENDILHPSDNVDNKRVKLEGSWGSQTEDLGTCLNQIVLLAEKSRLIFMEKAHLREESSMNHRMLLGELQERDAMIEHLHNSTREEIEKRDGEIYRLNRELFLMANVLDQYKKAVKQSDKAFSEYRQRCQLPEEPIYKDVGTGGLVLSITDIEKRHKKEEEELAAVCAILVQKAKDAEEFYALRFNDFLDNVNQKNEKLKVLESDFKSLKDSFSKRKVLETSSCAAVERCPTI